MNAQFNFTILLQFDTWRSFWNCIERNLTLNDVTLINMINISFFFQENSMFANPRSLFPNTAGPLTYRHCRHHRHMMPHNHYSCRIRYPDMNTQSPNPKSTYMICDIHSTPLPWIWCHEHFRSERTCRPLNLVFLVIFCFDCMVSSPWS